MEDDVGTYQLRRSRQILTVAKTDPMVDTTGTLAHEGVASQVEMRLAERCRRICVVDLWWMGREEEIKFGFYWRSKENSKVWLA